MKKKTKKGLGYEREKRREGGLPSFFSGGGWVG
jgi:hypothetical protein